MTFKQRSSGPFKMMGASPIREKKAAKAGKTAPAGPTGGTPGTLASGGTVGTAAPGMVQRGGGRSPVMQIDPLDLGLIDEAKKVVVNKGLPKNFNTKGSSGAGKVIKSKVDVSRASKVKTQNFRDAANKIKTVSSKTNVGSTVVDATTGKGGILKSQFQKSLDASKKNIKTYGGKHGNLTVKTNPPRYADAKKGVGGKKLSKGSASDRTLQKNLNKIADRYRTPKKTVTKKVVKKTATKVASRFAGLAGVALAAWDAGKFASTWHKTSSIEKAWDKHKWWGSKEGNLLKGDDPDPNKIKGIDKIRKMNLPKMSKEEFKKMNENMPKYHPFSSKP